MKDYSLPLLKLASSIKSPELSQRLMYVSLRLASSGKHFSEAEIRVADLREKSDSILRKVVLETAKTAGWAFLKEKGEKARKSKKFKLLGEIYKNPVLGRKVSQRKLSRIHPSLAEVYALDATVVNGLDKWDYYKKRIGKKQPKLLTKWFFKLFSVIGTGGSLAISGKLAVMFFGAVLGGISITPAVAVTSAMAAIGSALSAAGIRSTSKLQQIQKEEDLQRMLPAIEKGTKEGIAKAYISAEIPNIASALRKMYRLPS